MYFNQSLKNLSNLKYYCSVRHYANQLYQKMKCEMSEERHLLGNSSRPSTKAARVSLKRSSMDAGSKTGLYT